jgi:long-subunit fatty acid transport protein
MKINNFTLLKKTAIFFLILFTISESQAQDSIPKAPKSEFWKKVRFGLGGGLGINSGFTSISLAPFAVYQVNEQFSIGPGIQGNYTSGSGASSFIYGGSVISFYNPIQSIQLSSEFEQLRVSTKTDADGSIPSATSNFWNSSLFLGAGYQMGGVIIGIRYNVLFDKDKSIYPQAFIPFVRVGF